MRSGGGNLGLVLVISAIAVGCVGASKPPVFPDVVAEVEGRGEVGATCDGEVPSACFRWEGAGGACLLVAVPAAPCDDGNECTFEDRCTLLGQCTGKTRSCDDLSSCTQDGCDPAAGCVHEAVQDGLPCEDGSACTEGDHCALGTCVGGAASPECSCQTDLDCGGYEHDLCLGALRCVGDPGACVVDAGTKPAPCEDPAAGSCERTRCDPSTGLCALLPDPVGSACDDGDPCTTKASCDGAGACTQSAAVACADDDPCTISTCVPAGGAPTCLALSACECAADADCADPGDACLASRCLGSTCVVVSTTGSGPCGPAPEPDPTPPEPEPAAADNPEPAADAQEPAADAPEPEPDAAADAADPEPTPTVLVPGGPFLMGCDDPESCAEDTLPAHTVEVSTFEIDRTEVTVAEWMDCVAAGACDLPDTGGTYEKGLLDHPVDNVDHTQAQTFCVLFRDAMRLPTEAEWEKAARGTTTDAYPWGDDSAPSLCVWAAAFGCDGPKPVGSYPAAASPYGALDMAGNVAEWVGDGYTSTYYDSHPPDAWPPDPTGPATGFFQRVIRGGGYTPLLVYSSVKTWDRFATTPTQQLSGLGFRCAKPIGE